jgi:hypothetical protein
MYFAITAIPKKAHESSIWGMSGSSIDGFSPQAHHWADLGDKAD